MLKNTETWAVDRNRATCSLRWPSASYRTSHISTRRSIASLRAEIRNELCFDELVFLSKRAGWFVKETILIKKRLPCDSQPKRHVAVHLQKKTCRAGLSTAPQCYIMMQFVKHLPLQALRFAYCTKPCHICDYIVVRNNVWRLSLLRLPG